MRRYGLATAVLYDVFSLERPLYRPGRRAAIDALHLEPGGRVLVLGAGTGLDLAPIAHEIGARGTIVAVDDRAVMLRRSAARARRRWGNRRRADWPRLVLVQADAARARALLPPGEPPVDAVLAVNTLSLIPGWRSAWARAVGSARPGARVAVADIGRPTAGFMMRLWSPLISLIGGGRLDARPWLGVEEVTHDTLARSFHDGHVQLRTGTLP